MRSSGRATCGRSAFRVHVPPLPLGATAGLTAAVSRSIPTTSSPAGLQSHRTHGRLLSQPRTTEAVRRPRTTSRDEPKPISRHRASRRSGTPGQHSRPPWSSFRNRGHFPSTWPSALHAFRTLAASSSTYPKARFRRRRSSRSLRNLFEPVRNVLGPAEAQPILSTHGWRSSVHGVPFRHCLPEGSQRRPGPPLASKTRPEGRAPSTRTASRHCAHAPAETDTRPQWVIVRPAPESAGPGPCPRAGPVSAVRATNSLRLHSKRLICRPVQRGQSR